MKETKEIQNFGRNLRFNPKQIYAPTSESELLSILQEHRDGKVRAVASRHAWSDAIETEDTLIDVRHFKHVRVHENNGELRVTVGAGCQIKTLLAALNKKGLTIPSLGLITEQTIAGATATGTHGSGKHSLSHYVESLRVMCFDETGESAQVVEISDGIELQAGRCSLGCLGIVVELTLPCIPQYFVQEKATRCETIEEVLALEQDAPLQQFFLMPHSWSYFATERLVAAEPRRRGFAALYRIYWFLTFDLGMHLLIKLFASTLRSKRLVHVLFRSIVPAFVFPRWVVVDRSDRALVMEHELFRHIDFEVFVVRSQVVEAASFVADILRLADDAEYQLPAATHEKLQAAGLLDSLEPIKGRFTHHYPVSFRRILPDDTLISMASGSSEDWYSISFITYVEPREDFFALATFLANSMFELFHGRIHWGKWFPQTREQVNQLYPRMATFRDVCRRFDPKGVFRNKFVAEKLGSGENTAI